jgi:mono/diheme cytochrome c family protein
MSLVLELASQTILARAHTSAAAIEAGKKVYEDACLACHGPTGAGLPRTLVGFERPDTFPDFSQCDQSAPEYVRDWRATIIHGGPTRGFSEIMPAFGDALTASQIESVLAYLRSLCTDPSWAPGELNVPRALVTEKAFPEDELVWTTSVEAKGAPGVSNDLVSEWQFSARNELEVEVPFDFMRSETGRMQSGIGDVTVGVKHVLFFDLDANRDRGSILSVQAELVFPTGSKSKNLGTGEMQAGGFLAYDLVLPHNSFVQLQAGGDIPRHTAFAPGTVYSRLASGRSFSRADLGRLWSPMIEIVASRDLSQGARTDFDIVPQCQVTLNQRQHVIASLGYRIAVNDKQNRSSEVMLYVLWDWLDGKLTEGW